MRTCSLSAKGGKRAVRQLADEHILARASENPAQPATPQQIFMYPKEFFQNLGFTEKEAEFFVKNWNRKRPQTLKEVEEGLRWERRGREELAAKRLQEEQENT